MLSQKCCVSDSKLQSDLIRTGSACSCSVCNSICCFYIRNRKSVQPCSCNHLKISVDYVQPVKKEEIKEKYNLPDLIDYKNSDIDISSNTKYNVSGKVSNKSKPEIIDEIISLTETKSENKDKKEKDNPKVELSAQIMNVPYEEFKCSLSNRNNKSDPNPTRSNDSPIYKIKDLVKPDILTRLKEVYKACSCKVCECITDKSLPIKPLPKELPDKDLCNCTPCGCDECINSPKIKKLEPRPHSGCPCVKCDRKDCRGVVKKSMEALVCDCSPCDCLNCTDESTKSCTCEPCQCAECVVNNTRRKPLLPLDTRKNITQSTCQCKPCECANCTQVYTTMAANLIQDMSNKCSYKYFNNDVYLNDLLEFDEDICECDQNEQSDIDKKANDAYDNTTTFIHDQLIQTGYNNFNTIAMMAMYSTNYSKVEFNNAKDCKCLGCECLICSSRENEIKKKIYCNDFNNHNAVSNHYKACDCEACQCEVCNQVQNKLVQNLKRVEKNCSCSVCDCIMCDNKVISEKDNIGVTSKAQPKQSMPIQVTRDASSTHIYPLKKGKLLAAAMFDNEIYEPSCLKSQLCFSYNNFEHHKDVRTHMNSIEPPSKTLPKCLKPTNLEQIDVECENSQQYPNRDTDCPVRDIFSNNYLKNNNLRVGNTTSKDFYVPNDLNKSLTDEDSNLNSLEKHIIDSRTYGINSINCNEVACTFTNNPFSCFDEPKLTEIINSKPIYKETGDTSYDQSILSIFKSASESILDNISRTKHIPLLNNCNFERIHSNSKCDGTKGNIKIPKAEVEHIKKEAENSRNIKNKEVKFKCAYNKMYRRLIKRAQMNKKKKTPTKLTKANCMNDKNVNDTKVNIIENLKVTVDNQDINNLELTIKNKKTVDDFFSSEMNMLNKIKTDVQNIDNDALDKPWPILQKNFFVNCSEVRQNKGVCTIPDIELDVKHAVRFVSQQKYDNDNTRTKNVQCKYSDGKTQTQSLTVQVDKETNCNIFASRENLQQSMKCLLDMVLSRAVPVCTVNGISDMFYPIEHVSSNVPKVNAIDSCEGLKANIIELRRVSNHSLLVRWKVPQKTAYVQGYELQVDGRSVKKIFSPTRCMAVLTCLPRCDKLLLTIRTLTTSMLSDHYPATTIVYRPRIK